MATNKGGALMASGGTKKNGFVLYYDWISPLSDIPSEDFKSFILAMIDYELGNISDIPSFESQEARMASKFIFPQIDRAKRNAQNGSKGGFQKAQNNQRANSGANSGATTTNTNTITNTNTNTNTPPISPSTRGKCSPKANNTELEKRFDLFWKEYPRKADKQNALKQWNKIAPSNELTEQIINAVKEHRMSADWQRNEGQFIPLPSTWLNGKRWEDEFTPNTPIYPPNELDEVF